MDKYKKYYGVIIFAVLAVMLGFGSYSMISPKVAESKSLAAQIEAKEGEVAELQTKLDIVKKKIKQIKDSIVSSQKKIYSPIESDLGMKRCSLLYIMM